MAKRTAKNAAKTAVVESKMLNTRLPTELIRQIKIYCATYDMTIQEFMTEAASDKLRADSGK